MSFDLLKKIYNIIAVVGIKNRNIGQANKSDGCLVQLGGGGVFFNVNVFQCGFAFLTFIVVPSGRWENRRVSSFDCQQYRHDDNLDCMFVVFRTRP